MSNAKSPPNPPSLRESALNFVRAVETLASESDGIAGLHQNGDLARWDELLHGGRFSEWLGDAHEQLCGALIRDAAAGPDAFSVADTELTLAGIELIKRNAPPGELTPEHVGAIVEAAEFALALSATFSLRYEADMRAVASWRAASGDSLTVPDHVDLVVWMLDVLHHRPKLPTTHDVDQLIGSLRTLNTPGTGPVTWIRERAAGTLEQLAKAFIALGRRLYAAETVNAQLARGLETARRGIAYGTLDESAVERGAKALWEHDGEVSWQHASPASKRSTREAARACMAGVFGAGPEPKPGRCRICGCTEVTACTVEPAAEGLDLDPGMWSRPCGWADATKTLCDAPGCIAAAGFGPVREAEWLPPGVTLAAQNDDSAAATPPG
jgi:hypothetical protein